MQELPIPNNEYKLSGLPYRVYYGEDYSVFEDGYLEAWDKFDTAWDFLYSYERGVDWECVSYAGDFHKRLEFAFRDRDLALVFKLTYCNL